jgi:hypothetical protein
MTIKELIEQLKELDDGTTSLDVPLIADKQEENSLMVWNYSASENNLSSVVLIPRNTDERWN